MTAGYSITKLFKAVGKLLYRQLLYEKHLPRHVISDTLVRASASRGRSRGF